MRKIRATCVHCGAPANAITTAGPMCLGHAAQRSPEEGSWDFVGLRRRILLRSPLEALRARLTRRA